MKNGFSKSGLRMNIWVAQQEKWTLSELENRNELLMKQALEDEGADEGYIATAAIDLSIIRKSFLNSAWEASDFIKFLISSYLSCKNMEISCSDYIFFIVNSELSNILQ